MKYFIVEGIIKKSEPIDENIMKKHIVYSTKAIDEGLILMSGLKSNISGGLYVMKSESLEKVEEYLAAEPLKLANIQDYRITEFSPHYFNQSPREWFSN